MTSILLDAHNTVADRDKGYGDPVDSAERIAVAFNAITGREIFPKDVALIQILFKHVRSEHGYKRDHMLDASGYTWIKERCLLKEHLEKERSESDCSSLEDHIAHCEQLRVEQHVAP